MREYIIGVPEVHINWRRVTAENLDSALTKAEDKDDVDIEEIEEVNYDRTLETDEFKVRLPNGEEVSSEEAIDLESAGEVVGQ